MPWKSIWQPAFRHGTLPNASIARCIAGVSAQLGQPVLRSPAAIPLIEIWMPVCTRSSSWPARPFDLQMVQRVEAGEAVAYRACKRCIVGQAVSLTIDAGQRIGRALPLGFDGAEHFPAQARVGHEFAVARGQRQVALGQQHVHVLQQRAKERPLAVHLLQQVHLRFGLLARACSKDSTAVPNPYQPGDVPPD